LAYLHTDDPDRARAALEGASQHNARRQRHAVAALSGVIALRQADLITAIEAFKQAIEHADQILAESDDAFAALDSKGLAFSGLALAEGAHYLEQALTAYRAARAITTAAGVMSRQAQLLDLLHSVDPDALLATVRPIALNE
jgi:tetratricopeptide (TPR) repeat protein